MRAKEEAIKQDPKRPKLKQRKQTYGKGRPVDDGRSECETLQTEENEVVVVDLGQRESSRGEQKHGGLMKQFFIR